MLFSDVWVAVAFALVCIAHSASALGFPLWIILIIFHNVAVNPRARTIASLPPSVLKRAHIFAPSRTWGCDLYVYVKYSHIWYALGTSDISSFLLKMSSIPSL